MYYNEKDISLYYEKYGDGEKTILILPGWGDNRKTFYNIISYFKEKYTIYIMDYPGFGNSVFPNKDLTIYDYTNLIRNFMFDNNIENPIIIAHSFGGRIATLLSGYYKEKIDKIIMIDTAAIKPKKSIKTLFKQNLYKLLKKLAIFIPKIKKERYMQRLIKLFASSDYQVLSKSMQQTFKNIVNEDVSYYLKQVDEEVLILWGKNDVDTPLKYGIKTNKLIKHSALIVFPKGTHFSYLEYPVLTNRIIYEFIK